MSNLIPSAWDWTLILEGWISLLMVIALAGMLWSALKGKGKDS